MSLLSTPTEPQGRIVLSATDIVAATSCEYAAVRRLDVLLGRATARPLAEDPMGTMVAQLGDRHKAEHSGRVVKMPGVDA
jgi:hypothetical protein